MQDSDNILSDDEVSTNKERHSRLGEDNLNDTLEYDFSGQPLRKEEVEELQTKDSSFLPDHNASHEVEAKSEEDTNPLLMMESVPLITLLETLESVNINFPSPGVIFLASNNSAVKDTVQDLENGPQ